MVYLETKATNMIKKTIVILGILIVLSQHVYGAAPALIPCTLENMSAAPLVKQREQGDSEFSTRILHARSMNIHMKLIQMDKSLEAAPETRTEVENFLLRQNTLEMHKRYAPIYPLVQVERKLNAEKIPQDVIRHIADFLAPRGAPIRILEEYEKGTQPSPLTRNKFNTYYTCNEYKYTEDGFFEIKLAAKPENLHRSLSLKLADIPEGAFRTYRPFCVGNTIYQTYLREEGHFHAAVNGVFRKKGY
jgi:hypothetical protein